MTESFDPLVEERVTESTSVLRHESGDPMIVPRGETTAVRYTRASGLADILVKDIFHLKQWELLYLAQAMGRNPDLAAEAATLHYSTGPLTGTEGAKRREAKAALLDVVARALERERIHEAANAGTAVHKATEPGAPDGDLAHPLLAGAVEEYRRLTMGMERVASEVFIANDIVRAAGTFDAGFITPEFPGCIVIGDTKTGKNYHQGQFEVQLAVYSRGEVYLGPPKYEGVDSPGPDAEEVWEDQRIPFADYFGLPVNLDVGYLVHVPLEGKPKPRIVKLDLQRGWRLALQAAATRDARDEMDRVGVGEKVDTNGLAITEMRRLFDELFGSLYLGDEFRDRALALHQRFKAIWPQQYTDLVKGRLA